MQQFFNACFRADAAAQYEPVGLNILGIDLMRDWQSSLAAPRVGDDALRARLEHNFENLQALARTWQAVAVDRHPGLRRVVDEDGGPLVDVSPLRLTPACPASYGSAALQGCPGGRRQA